MITSRKPPPDDDAKAAREAHDWLEACYGTRAFAQGWHSPDVLRETFAYFPSKMQSECAAHCRWPREVVSLLQKWLVQDDTCRETGELWPLVRRAKVFGHWEVLAPKSYCLLLPIKY